MVTHPIVKCDGIIIAYFTWDLNKNSMIKVYASIKMTKYQFIGK